VTQVTHKPTLHLLVILLVCIGLLFFIPGSRPALAQDPPLVLAFYYAWYDQNTWNSGQPADQPVQPYISSDPATIERHVSQAQAAGIDALIQSWYGSQEANNQTETNFRTLLDVAAASGFHAAVDFETTSPFLPDQESVADALRYLLSVHTQHPAYLRYRGKPVIFFWRQGRFGVDEWTAIREQVDPHHNSLWIAEGVDIAYQAVFDGHHLYSIAWSPDVDQTLSDWGFRVRRYASQNGVDRLWVATVMPGYDDTHTGRADAFAVDRRDGDYYRETWSAAMASQPDWIVITSFNEWVEGTMIEPSLTYGKRYLDLTRELATAFKSGKEEQAAGSLGSGSLALETSAQEPQVESAGIQKKMQTRPYVQAEEAARVRSGPGTDYPRLGTLWPGDTAAAIGRNAAGTWWQIEFAAADNGLGWVSADIVTFVGDSDSVPVVGGEAIVTPISTPSPVITPAITLSPAATPGPTVTSLSTPKFSTPTSTPAPTLSPVPAATSAPTLTPMPTLTPIPSGSPAASPTPTGTPMLRTTPVVQRRPVALLWVGGGSLALAVGLGLLLIRAIRSKQT
jgi:uncharacterized protein YraI